MNRTVAVVGTGSIGMRHLSLLRAMDGVAAIAVPKRRNRLKALRDAGFEAVPSLREAAEQGAGRAIIASDTGEHAADALEALACDMDLLVEKPLAVDAAEGRKVAVAAAGKKRRVVVGCVLRFSESLNAFRRDLGKIGRPYAVRIECRSFLPDWRPGRDWRESYSASAAQGGVLRDLIHEIDYAGWIFGWPGAVSARLNNYGILGIASEETADCRWESKSGVCVSTALDYLSRPSRRTMSAYGTEGTLEWDGIGGQVTFWGSGGVPQTAVFEQTRDEMYLEQLRCFLGLSRVYEPADLEEGLKALQVCDAVRLSSQRARTEPVVRA